MDLLIRGIEGGAVGMMNVATFETLIVD